MKACAYPGCVSLVTGRRRVCAVHASEAGTACDACHGRGVRYFIGTKQSGTCDRCGGSGLLDVKRRQVRRRPKEDPVAERGLIRASET